MEFRKNLLVLLFVLGVSGLGMAQAPSWQWATAIGATPTCEPYISAVTTDAEGNFYLAASFSGQVTLGNTTLYAAQNTAMLVAKYHPNGTLLWAKKIGDATFGFYANAITASATGNLHLAGYYIDTVTFGNTQLIPGLVNGMEGFLATLDAAGNVVAAAEAGDAQVGEAQDLVIDAAGNQYLAGAYISHIFFGSLEITNAQLDANGCLMGEVGTYLVKTDPAGNVLWGVGTADHETPMFPGTKASVSIDSEGNSYLAGYFRDSMTVSNTLLRGTKGDNAFLAKFNSGGQLQWARHSVTPAYANATTRVTDVVTDAAGNTYITGRSATPVAFGSELLTGAHFIFLVKYSPSGDVVWAKKLGGGYQSSYSTIGHSLALDQAGNIVLAGTYKGTLQAGGQTFTTTYGEQYCNPFVATFNHAGDVLWVVSGNSSGYTFEMELAINAEGNCLLAGQFSPELELGNFTVSALSNQGSFAACLKLSFISGTEEAAVAGSLTAAPNPFRNHVTLSAAALNQNQPLQLLVFDALGRTIWSREIPAAQFQNGYQVDADKNWPSGLYILQVNQGEKCEQLKLVKE